MKIFEFNPGSTHQVIHLAHANGFPPQTYGPALRSLFHRYHILSFPARPFWGDTPAGWLHHWGQMADDLLAGIEKTETRPLIGIGHSLGGVLTLYAAIKRPDLFTRIILTDPTMLPPMTLWKVKLMKLLGLEFRNELVQGALRRRRVWESTEAAFRYFKSRPLFATWPEETIQAYAQSMTGPAREGGVELVYPPEWEARIYQTIPTDVWSFVPRLQQPVLLIRGENSNTFNIESEKTFLKLAPKAVVQVIQGAGHLVAQEKPDEVGRAITEFLQSS